MISLIRLSSLIALIGLSACTSLLESSRSVDGELWRSQSDALLRLQDWSLSGRFGIFNETEAWNGDLSWRQRDQQYQIQLSGPLGQGSALIKGANGYSELQLSESEIHIASDPESLLTRYLGLNIPVSGLRYWVLGIPAPKARIESMEVNDSQQITRMKQQGWDIRFKRYQLVEGQTLPTKIFLERQDLSVRLVVDQWKLES